MNARERQNRAEVLRGHWREVEECLAALPVLIRVMSAAIQHGGTAAGVDVAATRRYLTSARNRLAAIEEVLLQHEGEQPRVYENTP